MLRSETTCRDGAQSLAFLALHYHFGERPNPEVEVLHSIWLPSTFLTFLVDNHMNELIDLLVFDLLSNFCFFDYLSPRVFAFFRTSQLHPKMMFLSIVIALLSASSRSKSKAPPTSTWGWFAAHSASWLRSSPNNRCAQYNALYYGVHGRFFL